MSRGMTLAVRAAMAKTAVAVALIGMAAAGTTVLAHATPEFASVRGTPALLDDPDPGAPTGPDDPLCAQMPLFPVCQGGPYAPPPAPNGLQNPQAPGVPVPTSPTDPMCASMPGFGVCQGGPFAPPANPPASPPGEPGGPPFNAAIAPPPMSPQIGGGMPGGLGGMPGGLGGMPDAGGFHDGGGTHVGGGMHDIGGARR
jgi:hypothetical protein